MFKPVSNKIAFPKMEESILSFWEQDGTFKKSLAKNEGKDQRDIRQECRGPRPDGSGKSRCGILREERHG